MIEPYTFFACVDAQVQGQSDPAGSLCDNGESL